MSNMTISNLSVNIDGTVATTGGTATPVISKGTLLDQHNVILDDSSEFIAQTSMSFANKDPKVSLSAPNGYTQARRSVKILEPLLLDNGNYTTNSATIILSVDPETTDAEKLSLRVLAAQAIHDSDLDDFWNKGSMS